MRFVRDSDLSEELMRGTLGTLGVSEAYPALSRDQQTAWAVLRWLRVVRLHRGLVPRSDGEGEFGERRGKLTARLDVGAMS